MRDTLKRLMEAPNELQEFVISEAVEYLRLCSEHGLPEYELTRKIDLLSDWSRGFVLDFCESAPEQMSVEIQLTDFHDDYYLHIPYRFFFDREKWLEGQLMWVERIRAEEEGIAKLKEERVREYEMRKLKELQEKYPHISHESE